MYVCIFKVGLITLFSFLSCYRSENIAMQTKLNGIALEIFKANPGKTMALAPFAFRFPLCKLAAVATGGTKQELMSVLDIEKAEDTKNCFSSMYVDIGRLMETDMTLLNMMYLNYTDDISTQFIADAHDYGVTVSKIGFNYQQAAVTFVNHEFDSKTYKRIRDVLEAKDIDLNSSILIVNGIHMKTSWETNFKIKHTKNKVFRHHNKTMEVPMMNGIQQCLYLDDETERFKAISMKLANYGVSVMFLLPDPGTSIDNLLHALSQTPDTVQKIRNKMKWKNVNVFLPRFKIKTCLDWTQYLRQIGLTMTTNSTSTDLNAILNRKTGANVYLSKAKQKVFLEIDEMGTHRQDMQDKFDLRNQEESEELPEGIHDTMPEFLADTPFLVSISMISQNSPELELLNAVYYGPE